ncbi:MAG: triose-phosphate isomerase [Acidimicrobiales bacterium]
MARSLRPLVIGNWKMNLDHVEAVHLTQQLGVLLRATPAEHADVALAPPFVDLRSVSSVVESERMPVAVTAQHVNPHDSGAHTGEVSVAMLRRLGVTSVIVGHSERRQNYAMTDEVVAATLRAVGVGGLAPVLCVGEDLELREAGRHESHVRAQLESAVAGLEARVPETLSVAYEPIWAIGTGVSATTEEVRAMTAFVRATLGALGFADSRVLYGGSVNADTAAELASAGGVDGFLVGGASLRADSFFAIVQATSGCYAGQR